MARSKSQRAQISKSIRKHLRRALREQRNGRIQHVLEEFKDLDRLAHHARVPIHPCSTKKNDESLFYQTSMLSDHTIQEP